MKAIICEEFGALDLLKLKDVHEPKPKEDELLVKVKAIGVNFPDALLVQGNYQVKPSFPFIPGAECCAEVEAMGKHVTGYQLGDRVMGMSPTFGFYAEKAVVNAKFLFKVPKEMPDVDAANILTAHGTAHHALKQRAQLQAGETLVVLGAAGGTGLAAIQIGKALGARVIAVCSTQEKLDVAVDNGADEVINYSHGELSKSIKALTNGRGADVVFDPVGGGAFDACARSVARKGRLLIIGFASGTIPRFPVNLSLVKEYSVVGVFWGSFVQHEPEVFTSNMEELFKWYLEKKVHLHIDEVFPLSDAASALHKVMSRRVIGKVAIVPDALFNNELYSKINGE